MHSILVASDLSARSDRAVARAVKIARRHDARLIVQHVVDADLPHDIAKRWESDAKTRLATALDARAAGESLRVTVRITIGDPRHDIHQAAAEAGAELIVLGQHRDRVFLDYVRETTMEYLVRTSRLPVLLVSEPADRPYASILAAIDTSRPATEALRVACTIAPDADVAAFYAFHVPFKGFTGAGDSAESLRPYLAEAEVEIDRWMRHANLPERVPRPVVLDAGPHEAVEKMRQDTLPDLISIGAHGRAGIARLILGSFAAELIRDPPCDLLVAREPAAAGPLP